MCLSPPSLLTTLEWKDRPFYEVSLSVEDSFLVTGNIKHFPVTPKVVTPSQIIAIIEER